MVTKGSSLERGIGLGGGGSTGAGSTGGEGTAAGERGTVVVRAARGTTPAAASLCACAMAPACTQPGIAPYEEKLISISRLTGMTLIRTLEDCSSVLNSQAGEEAMRSSLKNIVPAGQLKLPVTRRPQVHNGSIVGKVRRYGSVAWQGEPKRNGVCTKSHMKPQQIESRK